MADIRYEEQGNEYEAPRVLFRGPPYGMVTDFILARGWAKTRRQAEIVLLGISVVCIGLVLILMFAGSTPDAQVITPEDAAQLEASRS